MSDRQRHRCLRPSHHRSGKEASHSEADLAQGPESELVEVLEALVLEVVSVLEETVAQVLVLVAEEDHQMASRTCPKYTSGPCHIANRKCISSRTDGKVYCILQMLHELPRENLWGTLHRIRHTRSHRSHLCPQPDEQFHLPGMVVVHNDLLELDQVLVELDLAVVEAPGLA